MNCAHTLLKPHLFSICKIDKQGAGFLAGEILSKYSSDNIEVTIEFLLYNEYTPKNIIRCTKEKLSESSPDREFIVRVSLVDIGTVSW